MIDNKKTPDGTPSDVQELNANLQQAIEEPKDGGDIRIKMTVSGGMPSESYDFYFEASGDGRVESRMSNSLTGREYKSQASEMSREAFVDLIRLVNISELTEVSRQNVPIPPDSLIGRLEISNGRETVTVFFMADEEQAKTAGYQIPDQLARVIDSVYRIAGERMDAKDVRP